MSTARLHELGPGRWRLEGELTLDTVAPLAKEGTRLAAAGSDCEIDLGGIDQSSSAAVALLLEWQGQVRRAGGRLLLHNAPDALARIAAFSNVDTLLGLQPA